MSNTYTVHSPAGASDYSISGATLIEAIHANFGRIAKEAQLGNAAGYRVLKASVEYRPGILGGKGGCALSITAKGLYPAPGAEAVKTTEVWIHSEPSDMEAPRLLQLP